jgi:site-specific DNA-methyltransferase (adenine-specific)
MRKEVIGNCTLYLGDCMELMATLPDKSIDFAIVDPPYGIGADKGTGSFSRNQILKGKKWDKRPGEDYFRELFRVSENQMVFGGNYFSLPIRQGWICWYKSDEIKGRCFSEFELAWTSFNKAARHYTEKPFIRDGQRIHPTQKPIALYKWVLSKYANPGMKILDTHFGSGSLAVACNEMGFSLVASEIDEDYFQLACKRIKKNVSENSLCLT